MAIMFEQDKSTFVSEPTFPIHSRVSDDYPCNVRMFAYGDFGGGTVTLEVKMPDDTWQSFPETTFNTTTAQSLELFEKAVVRLNFQGCTSVSVLLEV